MPRMKVKKSDPPETKEVLAESIVKISDALTELLDSGLNEQAIVILLHHKTKVPIREIKTIFDGLRTLKSWYCR